MLSYKNVLTRNQNNKKQQFAHLEIQKYVTKNQMSKNREFHSKNILLHKDYFPFSKFEPYCIYFRRPASENKMRYNYLDSNDFNLHITYFLDLISKNKKKILGPCRYYL